MKEKILILEDEIGIRSFVSINLKREGYEVIEAGTIKDFNVKINLDYTENNNQETINNNEDEINNTEQY